MLPLHYLPPEWQLVTIPLLMREMDSAFLFQMKAIDVPRIVSGEGKPTAKCSLKNNLQSAGQAWGQRRGLCRFALIRAGQRAPWGARGIGSRERVWRLTEVSTAGPWDSSLSAQDDATVRHEGHMGTLWSPLPGLLHMLW